MQHLRDDLIALSALIDTGRVRPVIDREFALREVQDAVRYVASGQAHAKVILRIT